MSLTDLRSRTGLPDALRVLLQDFPRESWEGHDNFGQLVRFWLERHVMFRDLVATLNTEAEQLLDGRSETAAYLPRLSRYGGFFLNQLHGHHQVEDMHYFPRLVGLDPRIDRGFEILETDHVDIDGMLHRFAETANGVLSQAEDPAAAREATGRFHAELQGFGKLLERHLNDEEEIIVPVILKSGFDG